MHFGIDYGSKVAGTTVITYDVDGSLQQVCSVKKQDADQLILDTANSLRPEAIYLDAPLSLPAAYFGKGSNYHYRAADKQLRAMSPMFLGGLTARAMSLRSKLEELKVSVFETYPGAYIRSSNELSNVYSKKELACIPSCLTILEDKLPIPIGIEIKTLHQLDSIVAWYSGYRHQQGVAKVIGDIEEGVIIF